MKMTSAKHEDTKPKKCNSNKKLKTSETWRNCFLMEVNAYKSTHVHRDVPDVKFKLNSSKICYMMMMTTDVFRLMIDRPQN